jgi:hypothetical protein
MSFQEAIAADQRKDLQSAAAAYESVLAGGEGSLQALLNLAVLYWQATDIGLAAAKKLSPAFLATAGRRFPELLAEAHRRFPGSTEARFWQRYIAWADLGEPFSNDECRQLLREDPATLVPAMHLFAISQGKEAEAEASALLRQCRKEETTRARYVVSVIESVMKHAGLRR